jgi:hypothetical protein
MLQYRAVDGTEEPLRVDVVLVRLPTLAMTAVGDDDLVWLSQLSAQCLRDRSRDSRVPSKIRMSWRLKARTW